MRMYECNVSVPGFPVPIISLQLNTMGFMLLLVTAP